jgi:hypothetical protein
MKTTLNTSCSENTMVLSARRGVSALHVFSSLNNDLIRFQDCLIGGW